MSPRKSSYASGLTDFIAPKTGERKAPLAREFIFVLYLHRERFGLFVRFSQLLGIEIRRVAKDAISPEGFEAIKESHYIFGCVDEDGPRFVINDIITAYGKSYIDDGCC